jgi:H+/Cl- antiporter ClcA
MTGNAAPPLDPGAVVRSKRFRVLLVFAAAIGLVVSVASWGFLELIHELQGWVFEDLPDALGFEQVPAWWPLPVLALASVPIAFAIGRLPGHGGHEPSAGLTTGKPPKANELPGVLLAAIASIGLGFVLGPEAPLLALGTGLATLAVRRARADAPEQVLTVLAAAGAFAALSTVFGSPVIGAVIIIEAAGLGGPTLPLVLLPGLLAAGIGSMVFIGMGEWTGLSAESYEITPLSLPAYTDPRFSDFLWTIAVAVVAAMVTLAVMRIGREVARRVRARPTVVVPVAGVAIAGLAIAFSQMTDLPAETVLFSGQEAMNPVVNQAAALSLGTLGLLVLFKGLAWGISLGSARGGPTFPAILLGIVGGLMASHLPGFAQTPAVAVLVGAACVSVLRLPLSSVLIALLVSQAGFVATPLVIVGVVVAYLTVSAFPVRQPPEDVASSEAPMEGGRA